MFSFALAFVLLVVPEFDVFEASHFYSLLQVFRKFRSFLNFEKIPEKSKIKISTSKVTQGHLGLTMGALVAQAASWRGLPPGRAHRAPGAHRAAIQVCLLPSPPSLSKNTSSALCSCVLAALRPEFQIGRA